MSWKDTNENPEPIRDEPTTSKDDAVKEIEQQTNTPKEYENIVAEEPPQTPKQRKKKKGTPQTPTELPESPVIPRRQISNTFHNDEVMDRKRKEMFEKKREDSPAFETPEEQAISMNVTLKLPPISAKPGTDSRSRRDMKSLRQETVSMRKKDSPSHTIHYVQQAFQGNEREFEEWLAVTEDDQEVGAGSQSSDSSADKKNRALSKGDRNESWSLDELSLSGESSGRKGAIPSISPQEARTRSYLFGSASTRALLGSGELQRYFPTGRLRVCLATWNMNGQMPPENLDDLLLPEEVDTVADLYVVGSQESYPVTREWEVRIQETLGPSHVLLHSVTFGVLHLALFIRREHVWFCSEIEDASLSVRPPMKVKTKGAACVAFMFFGTSMLFVNCHLTAHEDKVKSRVNDIKKVMTGIDLPQKLPIKTHLKKRGLMDRFDAVFWLGDLNFRITKSRDFVLDEIRKPYEDKELAEVLMKHDQLKKQLEEGCILQGFREAPVTFLPTFKYDIATDIFDSSPKQRTPSYTDRILYKGKRPEIVRPVVYASVPNIRTSDHKPVLCIFDVQLKPGRDSIPLAAGKFNREVYLEALTRRKEQACKVPATPGLKASQSSVCAIQ